MQSLPCRSVIFLTPPERPLENSRKTCLERRFVTSAACPHSEFRPLRQLRNGAAETSASQGDKELNLNGIALRFNPFAISNKENEIGLDGDRVTGKRIAVLRQYEAC